MVLWSPPPVAVMVMGHVPAALASGLKVIVTGAEALSLEEEKFILTPLGAPEAESVAEAKNPFSGFKLRVA